MKNDEEFRDLVARKDEYKTLSKKLAMLKQAMRDEKQLKKKNQEQRMEKNNKYQKLLGEIEWKTSQNERLVEEIRQLKQEILDQRNIKRKLREANQFLLKGSSPLPSEKGSKY